MKSTYKVSAKAAILARLKQRDDKLTIYFRVHITELGIVIFTLISSVLVDKKARGKTKLQIQWPVMCVNTSRRAGNLSVKRIFQSINFPLFVTAPSRVGKTKARDGYIIGYCIKGQVG